MGNTIYIPNRVNWIDWAKAIAISFVVFGHIPQLPGSFPQYYIVTFHMPLFFFISGFLTKKENLNKETLKKYWHTLIIPYFAYNLLFYPYWIVRHYIEYPESGLYDYIKPIIGTIMFQCETNYSESLNGVTWFIVALLGYKIILSLCNKFKHGNKLIIFLIIITAFLYIINEFNLYTKNLTPIGFIKCFPFFFWGYYSKNNKMINSNDKTTISFITITFLAVSLSIFFSITDTNNMVFYAIRFWSICISAITGIIGLCKLIDKFHFNIIDNISIGTIVIMGLHFILIGSTNFLFEKTLCAGNRIIYTWFQACILVFVFEVLLYPIIILFMNKMPFLLGKKKTQ